MYCNLSYLTKCSFTFFANLSGCHPDPEHSGEGTGATAPKNKAQKDFFRILPRFLLPNARIGVRENLTFGLGEAQCL